MPCQGQHDNMIDRFDGRDIDRIPVVPKVKEIEDVSADERHCNYERYRILAQNDFLGISEEKYLHQLYLEEQFGINAQFEMEKPKKKTGTGAAIPFTYEDSNDINVPFTQTIAQVTTAPSSSIGAGVEEEYDSDLDVDVAIDVTKIDTAQAHELNACGRHYGMKSNDFYSFLTKDSDEADALKLAREEEQEKIMLSGRKSRRERRAQRERRFPGRPISPPSYAAKEEEPAFKEDDDKNDSAESRSSTPENSGKEGPTCGLVALSMLVNGMSGRVAIDANDLLQISRQKVFTKNGEMFSATNLFDLVKSVIQDVDGTNLKLFEGKLNCDEIKQVLKSGGCLLVPYDPDFNHGPCILNGRKAHWALIIGYLIDDNNKFHVFSRHGKTKNIAIWSLKSLSDSNANLNEFEQPKGYPDAEFILPMGGIGGQLGLKNKCIIVKTVPVEEIVIK